MYKMHHHLVDTGITGTGFFQYLIDRRFVATEKVQRQWLRLIIDIANHFIEIAKGHNRQYWAKNLLIHNP